MMKNVLIVFFSALLIFGCSQSKLTKNQLKRQKNGSHPVEKSSKSIKKASKQKKIHGQKKTSKSKKSSRRQHLKKIRSKTKVKKTKQLKQVKKSKKKSVVKKVNPLKKSTKAKKLKKPQSTYNFQKSKKTQKKLKKTVSKKLKTLNKAQKPLTIMVKEDLSQASERYLIYTLHRELIYLQEALSISSTKIKRVRTVDQALNFQSFPKNATLIYLMDIKKFQKIEDITHIGQHFARKSFWFISYTKAKEIEKFKTSDFNGLKTNLVFIHDKDFKNFIENIKDHSTLKQLLKSSCLDEKECRNFSLGNDYLIY